MTLLKRTIRRFEDTLAKLPHGHPAGHELVHDLHVMRAALCACGHGKRPNSALCDSCDARR